MARSKRIIMELTVDNATGYAEIRNNGSLEAVVEAKDREANTWLVTAANGGTATCSSHYMAIEAAKVIATHHYKWEGYKVTVKEITA